LTEARTDIRAGVDPALLERERSLRRALDSTAERQLRLIATKLKEQQAANFERELFELQAEYDKVQTRIRQTSPRYAALTQPEPLKVSQLQTDVLDADTLLLEYSLGTEHSYLWAVTKDSLTSYELPARAEIEEQARQVYEVLSQPDAWAGDRGRTERGLDDTLAQARRAPESITNLSRTLLAPVAGQLGRKRLLIVADGALQFIPFAALSNLAGDEGIYNPLIREHEVVSLPSASTLAVLRHELQGRKPAPKQLAMLADPVFGRKDERVKAKAAPAGATHAQAEGQRELTSEIAAAAGASGAAAASFQLPRLPGTRYEAEQILALVPAAERREALDFAASRATATDPDLSQYRYVHFATHGLLNSQHPELSGLVLTLYDEQGRPQDGFLRAHEIYNLRLPAEMVVLSACQTGLGKVIRGEGLVGLTRGFMYAGTPRVVVSLWSVSDVGTAELMTRFYKGILQDGLRPAQALQAAQVSMLKDKRFAAPFYWAAFTLQGEWR
jgi:CHAT domain-containing protein